MILGLPRFASLHAAATLRVLLFAHTYIVAVVRFAPCRYYIGTAFGRPPHR
jgi:hypothetical protein